MRITTNHGKRPVISGYALTDKERKEFDYYTPEQLDDASFFRYKGNVYDLGEFSYCEKLEQFKGWHGYKSDSYFSGIVIKWVDKDCEEVIVGTYIP